jgi:hypothetical protein
MTRYSRFPIVLQNKKFSIKMHHLFCVGEDCKFAIELAEMLRTMESGSMDRMNVKERENS